MDIYREKLLDHYNNPRNYGELAKATASSKLENVSCGDAISMQLQLKDKHLQDIKFTGEGCAIAIAAASILSEYAKGKDVNFLQKLSLAELLELMNVQLTPSRLKCASLSLDTLKKALLASKS